MEGDGDGMQGNSPDEEYEDPHGECRHEIKRLREDRDRLLGACRRLVNDSMYKDHPEASQMAIDAIAAASF